MTTRENDLISILNEKDALIEQQRRTIAKFVAIFEAEDPFDRDHVSACREAMTEARALLQGDKKE